jgi:RNA polymerase sigma-70 factor (ECF subfamily)
MERDECEPLVVAARRGEPDAWRELYRLHNRRLTVWLSSLLLPDSAASPEDIAAEAWLTAAGKISGFGGGDDGFAAWLFTIARNHASNSRRTALRRRTDPVSVQDAPESTWGSTSSNLAPIDELDSTRQLLSHLTPREAEVVACIDVVGLDVASTAAALGMKPTAVRVARHRALGRLRRVLTSDASEPAEGTAINREHGVAASLPTRAAPEPGG